MFKSIQDFFIRLDNAFLKHDVKTYKAAKDTVLYTKEELSGIVGAVNDAFSQPDAADSPETQEAPAPESQGETLIN